MNWETLPNWIWIIFYLFLLTSLGISIWNVSRKKMIGSSIAVIVVTITIPITGIINSIERHKGVNEFEHLVSELQQGSFWSLYIIIGLLYVLSYWSILAFKYK